MHCETLVLTICFLVYFEVPRRRDKSPTSSHSNSSKQSRSSSRSSSSSRSDSYSRNRSFSRSSSFASQRSERPREKLRTHRRVHDGSQHVLPTTGQSPKSSISQIKHQSTADQSHNTATEERANRFDRALLREQVDGNSPRKEFVVHVSKHQYSKMFGNISAEQIKLTRHNGHHNHRQSTCAR